MVQRYVYAIHATLRACEVNIAEPSRHEPLAERRLGNAGVIALLGGAQALVLVAGMARWKIIAILLGPGGVGIAGVIDQTAQLALQIGQLNIPTVSLRFLAIAQEDQGSRGAAWLYRTLLRAVLSTTALVAAVVTGILLLRPGSLGVETTGYVAAVAFALAATPLTAATGLIRNVLATLHRHRAAATTLLMSSLAIAGGSYVGLRIGGLSGAYLAALIVGLLTAGALHRLVVSALPAASTARPGSLLALLQAHPDIVRFSLTLYAVGFTVPLGYWVVRWKVLQSLGPQSAGFLVAALTLATGVRAVFSQASTQYLLPLASRNLPKEVRAAEVARYVRTLSLLLLLAALPLLLFPHEVLLVLYSRQFIAAADVLGVLVLSEVILAIADAYRMLQLGFNDLAGFAATTLTGVTITGIGIWWVVPAFGLRGVALLQLAVGLVVLMQSIIRVRSRHRVRVGWRTFAMEMYVISALAAAALIGRAVPEPGTLHIAAKAAVAALMLTGGWMLVPAQERDASWLRLLTRLR